MWHETREGPVVLARFRRPPMNYSTDADVDQLDGLLDAWRDPSVAAVVLAGGLPGKFVTDFDVDAVAAAMQFATRIAPLSPMEVAMAKKVVYQGMDQPLDTGLAFEVDGPSAPSSRPTPRRRSRPTSTCRSSAGATGWTRPREAGQPMRTSILPMLRPRSMSMNAAGA